jgi:hypothetical protein
MAMKPNPTPDHVQPADFPIESAFFDAQATRTRIVSESERWPVAHMFVLDKRAGRTIEDGRLEIRLTKLEDRKFDGCKLVSNGSADLETMLPLWTFKSSTATLIGERHVLAAGHATITKDIHNTWFLFGRTQDSDSREVVDGKLSIPLTDPRVARALRVVHMQNENPEAEGSLLPDWALIEIEWASSALPVEPIPLAMSVKLDNDDEIVGHSLGAPQLAAQVRWREAPQYGIARLFADLGSGGSGSPVISNDEVIGVLSGNAVFTPDQKQQHEGGCHIIIAPKAHGLGNSHLVTLASHIRAELSRVQAGV